ncbi:MAG: hypothetical protein WDN04_15885 [Rhodospirillales bacterium]
MTERAAFTLVSRDMISVDPWRISALPAACSATASKVAPAVSQDGTAARSMTRLLLAPPVPRASWRPTAR